jgi:NAD-dependent deacetylase
VNPSRIPAALVETLRAARAVAVLTGAGISAESGIATFRDAGGLWEGVDPEEVATPGAYRRDPAKVWRWYQARRAAMQAAVPNPGHLALAAMEAAVEDFTLVTQNIDGLHTAAGSKQVIELHGNIGRARCSAGGEIVTSFDAAAAPPPCPTCGAPLRPDVVWFGELLPVEALEAAWAAAVRCDVLLAVGTSAVVEPAASLPLVALESGATVIEVNPEPTPLSAWADYVLRGPAGEVLPVLVARGLAPRVSRA